MDKKIIEQHIKEKSKQEFTNKKYSTFYDGKVLQICFYSKGCRYSKNGSCIMCDYGNPRKENLTPNDIKDIMNEIFTNLKVNPKVLLINSLGSVFDKFEMSRNNFIILLDEISKLSIDVVIFETHYATIDNEVLTLIKNKLINKQISIEIGLESSNENYRRNYLNKIMDNEKLLDKVRLVKSFDFIIEANVIFGMPFLSIKEQIQDTIESIKWSFENNIDKVNLFPINIKPYTLLYKLYELGEYMPVQHKDFIYVLQQIPKEYIDKIYLCWYGNRTLNYNKKSAILPLCDKSDYDRIMQFYNNFNLNKEKEFRKKILDSIKL